jgi:diguanylate cyclase (GGDEF)-like protein/PAS domain S-box-containing protein
MEVRDAQQDARFSNNPLVTAAPHIRFYAGAPIVLKDGLRMGTLCVIDHAPRELTLTQRKILKSLAQAAGEAFDQRLLALDSSAAQSREFLANRDRAEALSRLRSIVDGTRAGTWEWNIQTGETRINSRWAEIIGYTLEEITPLSRSRWAQLAHPDDLVRSLALLEQHFRGEIPFYDCEIRVKHKAGHWIWVHSRGKVATWSPDGKAEWIFGTHLDITNRKDAERLLKKSEAFLDRTGRLAGVGGWEADLTSSEITWSDETCRIHGVPLGFKPTLGEAIAFYPSPARERVQAAVERGLSDGSGWDLELPLLTEGTRDVWVRMVGSVEFANGKPVRMVGAFQDVTAKRRAMRALEASEHRFRKLFESSTGLICTHDLDGILLSVNPAAARSLGYSMAEMLGRRLSELMQPQGEAGFNEYLANIARTGRESGNIELIAKDGSIRTWEFHNILDRDDEDPFVLGHAQDVTERKLHEQKLLDWSIRDPLTGCFNRRYLHELISSSSASDMWGCVVIDLDHFKHVNDTQGHEHGDVMLVAISKYLATHVRPQDAVIRTGGDEFLILLKDANELTVSRVVDRLCADRERAPTAFSVGWAVRQLGVDFKDALARADQQLYALRRDTRR